jgi:hypothetical protein
MLRTAVLIALLTVMMWGIEVYKVYLSDDATRDPKTGEYNLKTVSDRFSPDTPRLQVAGMYRNATVGEEVQVIWIAEDAISTPNYTIVTSKMNTSTNAGVLNGTFTKGKGPLPVGKYRIDIVGANGKMLAQKAFWIEKPRAGIVTDQATPAKVTEIVVARSLKLDAKGIVKPIGVATRFSKIGNAISMAANFDHFKLGTVASIQWYAEKLEGKKPNMFLLEDKVNITRRSGTIRDTLTWRGIPALPNGTYRVEIRYGGKVLAAKQFEIAN